jgi:catechol 2,3-dioxygenase
MSYSIPKNTKIGHVHLKVANLDRSLKFYCDILGFSVKQRVGDQVAFIAASNYHHHLGLNTWESKNGTPPKMGSTGLYHTAILYPTRKDLSDIYKRLLAHDIELTGAADHGVSEALYLNDPDQNGVELYWDKPEKLWPYDSKGNLNMFTAPLDLNALLKLQ